MLKLGKAFKGENISGIEVNISSKCRKRRNSLGKILKTHIRWSRQERNDGASHNSKAVSKRDEYHRH